MHIFILADGLYDILQETAMPRNIAFASAESDVIADIF